MDTLSLQRGGLWQCLLWKDFMQVRPTLVAVVVGCLVMQLLLLLASSWLVDAEAATPVIACVAPIFFAIGSSGMLVGHERQSGAWDWSSSLPVSWRSAVGSKMIVTTTGALLTALTLAIVPVILLTTGNLKIDNTSLVVVYLSGTTVIALLQVVAYFFLATLLIGETLTALVIAGMGLVVVQVFIPSLALSFAAASEGRLGSSHDLASSILAYTFSLVVLVVGMAVMLLAFRWRWTTGQKFQFALPTNASSTEAPSTAYIYSGRVAPGLSRVLFRLALASSRWLRISAVALVGLMSIAASYYLQALGGEQLNFMLLTCAMGLFGLSAFEGDQAQQRYRFLADRGIVPWRLVLSRLRVAGMWAIGLAIVYIALQLLPQLQLTEDWLGAIANWTLAFLVSALAAICFRKSVVAATVALGTLIGSLILYVSIMEYLFQQMFVLRYRDHLLQLSLMCSPLPMLVLLVAIFVSARRWIVLDGLHLPFCFWGWVMLALTLQIIAVLGVVLI